MGSRLLGHLQRHLVGYLALFVALGGTSFAAAALINGSQIKPHTIPKNRLTNSAIASLKGRAGPAGPAGPAGVSGYQRVSGPTVTVAAGAEGTATADCPTGKQPLGGAFFRSTPGARLVASDSAVNINDVTGAPGWSVTMFNEGPTSANFHMLVICATVS